MTSLQVPNPVLSGRNVERASHPREPALTAFTALLCLYPFVRIWVGARGHPPRLPSALQDDAYYYLRIAENLAHRRESTFGLIEHTNGYHPLWQFLLVPLAAIWSGNALVVAMEVVQGLLFCGFVLTCRSIARQVGASGWLGVGSAVYGLLIGSGIGALFFAGMENALVLLFLALLARQVLQLFVRDPAEQPRWSLWFGLLSAGLVLSRIDAVLFPVLLVALLSLRRAPRVLPTRQAGIALAIPLGVLLVYAGVNQLVFSTPVPISGQAKAIGGGSIGLGTLRAFLDFGRYGRVPFVAGAQALVLAGLALVALRWQRGRRAQEQSLEAGLATLIGALVVAQLGQLAYFQLSSSWRLWPWYYYYLPFLLFLSVLVVLRALVEAGLPRLLVPIGAVLLALALVKIDIQSVARAPGGYIWYTNERQTAEWLNTHAPPGSTVAIGDRAGRVGWTYHGPVLQLEGLVQDHSFLDYLKQQRLTDAMTRHHVVYYVRSEGGVNDIRATPPAPASSGCSRYLEPVQGLGPKSAVVVCDDDLVYRIQGNDGSTWSVWRYLPDRQHP